MTQVNWQGLNQVLSLFPEQALDALVRFEALPDADQRPEVPDYRSMISELEKEIATVLYDTLDNSRQADAANQNNVIPRRPE